LIQQRKVNRLLEQSVALADVMKFAFQTRSGVPSNDINIVDQTTVR
jgi:mannosyl-oligosaccharide alpha-1,2-mannosidase